MDPFDSSDTNAVGWHLIARGGDMTARVHAHMQLGVLPSGDFSFEAPDAVVELDTQDEQLCITVVSEGFELEIGDGQRTRDLKVSPQTHVRLEFLGHLLDIDNDFAVASAPGDALEVHVLREGESRVLPESLRVPHRGSAEIIVAEQFTGGRSRNQISDSLQREHAAARADKQLVRERGTDVRRIVGALAGSVLVILTLVVVALNVAERTSVPDEPSGTVTERGSEPARIEVQDVTAGAGDELLDRFKTLLESDPLPDKATLDFAVESLRSLGVAYPDDPAVPAALAQLAQRLVVEARAAYDSGDAFRAGRLIEQAATIGLARSSVDQTLAYFDSRPPGTATEAPAQESASAAAAPAETATESATEGTEVQSAEGSTAQLQSAESPITEAVTSEAMLSEAIPSEADLSEAMLADAIALEMAAMEAEGLPPEPVAPAADGLDQLVESATGIALGALAVDMVITDTSQSEPTLAGVPGPFAVAQSEAGTTGGDVENRVQVALERYLTEALSERPVDASQLPAGFAEEDLTGLPTSNQRQDLADELAGLDTDPVPSGPIFRPFSELIPTEQVPLAYPRRALDGAEGTVEVEFTVTETGEVTALSIQGDAPAVFIREAARAIRQWRFQPVQVNGTAVPVQTGLRVTFRG